MKTEDGKKKNKMEKKYNFIPESREQRKQLGTYLPVSLIKRIEQIAEKKNVTTTTVVKAILSTGVVEIENENTTP